MAEVREKCSDPDDSHSKNYGLFATKNFAAGDVILVELSTLIQLSPALLSHHERQWVDSTADQKPKSSDCGINGVASSEEEDSNNSKFRAMVQVGLYFLLNVGKSKGSWKDDPDITELRQLYHPLISSPTDLKCQADEREIVELSLRAFLHLQSALRSACNAGACDTETKESIFSAQLNEAMINFSASDDKSAVFSLSSDWELHTVVREIMLIWACNAFHGGLIYRTFSRINHSCNPNAVIVVPSEGNLQDHAPSCVQQNLVACCEINTGDEICISYLHGSFLYADRTTRRNILLEDKYFECFCDRCCSLIDHAGAIPCPVCHPRELRHSGPDSSEGILLSEDVQYDDDHDVNYVYPIVKSLDSKHSGEKEIGREQSKKLHQALTMSGCSVCHTTGYIGETNQSPQAFKKLFETNHTIVEKVVVFLRRHDTLNSTKGFSMSAPLNDDHVDEEEREASLLIHSEQMEQLLRMSSSVLGAKHWTTNILLLLQLNQTLTQLNARSILSATGGESADDEEEDIETTIAEAIDMLQRLVRFVEGLQLKLHVGHLLSNVIVGTARALVSLGDVKSQKYAAKWLDKIVLDHYVDQFESAGVQAVVHRLHVAWQRGVEDDNRPEKRTKR